ncbi:inactive Ufm1-specific protease 1 [Nannospalax galili]|uniref:inactive Ufm1-specific protease 1 n=1 Tax=Nannospalax galili TaxID=1026970 RepID=UPI0004ED1A79|nr:inactive Ufm1-specific protease 1 [Nannospalax galili]
MRYTTHAQAAFFSLSPPPALVLSLLWGGARACALIIPKSQGRPRKCSKAVPCRQSGSGSLLVAPSPAANLSGKNSGSAAPVLPVAHPGDRSVAALEPLKDVHVGLAPPCQDPGRLALLSGHYLYYHYGCDGLDDRGWGCGYRTLQTLCSWPQGQSSGVPGLAAVQAALEDMGDKTSGFRDSRSWIGCVEASLCLQHFGGPQGRLRHVPRGTGLWDELKHLYSHFAGGGGPVMVGGDADAQSKALLGVCTGPEAYVLVLDPHYWGTPKNPSELQDAGWVSWRKVSTVFDSNSFYNLCLTSRT